MGTGTGTEYELEQFVDRTSLRAVLQMLSAICHEKAEHLAGNWQDDGSARPWGVLLSWVAAAKRLDNLAETLKGSI